MQPVMETILHRRSIRRFAPEQIREETLAQSSAAKRKPLGAKQVTTVGAP